MREVNAGRTPSVIKEADVGIDDRDLHLVSIGVCMASDAVVVGASAAEARVLRNRGYLLTFVVAVVCACSDICSARAAEAVSSRNNVVIGALK